MRNKNILLPSMALLISCVFSFPQTKAPVGGDLSTSRFWVPKNPPRARYAIECRIDPEAGILEGKEVIRFKPLPSLIF